MPPCSELLQWCSLEVSLLPPRKPTALRAPPEDRRTWCTKHNTMVTLFGSEHTYVTGEYRDKAHIPRHLSKGYTSVKLRRSVLNPVDENVYRRLI